MSRRTRIDYRFVNYVPEELDEGVVYIAPEFGAVMHKCCCGCGNNVSTPLNPAQWTLTFDGETISLSPSVGSWGLPCHSHYWIRRNQVLWSKAWSDEEIASGRIQDRLDAERFYGEKALDAHDSADDATSPSPSRWWKRIFRRR